MADVVTWLFDHPGILGDAALVFLVADRWVHRRENSEQAQGEHLERVDTHLEHTDSLITRINEVASERHSLIMTRILMIELDMREVKTLLRMRQRPRPDPSDIP